MHPSRPLTTAITLLASVISAGCGGDSTDPAALPTVSVLPAAAPPGAPVRITVTGAGALPSGATVSIGGFPAPLLAVSAGEWRSAVPLFLTETGRALPESAVDVVLLDGEATVAAGLRVLTVTAPPEAAGASHRALERLAALSAALTALVDDMPGDPGPDAQVLFAVTRTLPELVDGTGSHSLRTAITSLEDDPAGLALLDSWFQASGVLDVIDRQAALVEAIAAGAAPATMSALQASRSGVPTVISDVELARRMQLYEVAKLFGETVVSPTAANYGNIVGIGTGALGLAGLIATPVATTANVISAVLAVTDFMINKVAVGVLPARIDSFGMDVTKALLEPGEVTDARLEIIASNAPPPIGVQDMVGLILAGLGAIPAREAASLREKLLDVASFALNTMQSFISQYASANPGANLDTELISVPDMTWQAVVIDPRLVARLTHTPGTITGLEDAVNWQAASDSAGEGRIYARTMVGPSLLSLPPGFEYNGGAFGDNIVATEPVTVMVQQGALVLEAEFPATVAIGGSAELRVRAGHSATGTTTWAPGIQLTLTPEGGSVAAGAGITDAEGYFTTTAQLGEGSGAISIRIDASDGALAASRTVSATARAPAGVIPVRNGSFSNVTTKPGSKSAAADWLDFSGFAADLSTSNPYGTATASASQSTVFHQAPTPGFITMIESITNSTAWALREQDPFGSDYAAAENRVNLTFDVSGEPVDYVVRASCTLPPDAPGAEGLFLIQLYADTTSPVTIFEQTSGECPGIALSGTLPPGRYRFGFMQRASVYTPTEAHDLDAGEAVGSSGLRLEFHRR